MKPRRQAVLALVALSVAACQPDLTPPHSTLAPPAAPSNAIVANSGTWATTLAPPHSRREAAGAWLGGKFYMVGGYDNATNENIRLTERYDPVADKWDTVAAAPLGVSLQLLVPVNGYLYSVGGRVGDGVYGGSPSTAVWRYDPVADGWTTVASLPTAKAGLTGVVAGGKIYAFGGINSSSNDDRTVYRYSPATDRWVRLADLQDGGYRDGAATYNGKIYAFINGTTLVWRFDIASGQWTFQMSATPGSFDDPQAGVINTIVYVANAGGATFGYDPGADTWHGLAARPGSYVANSASAAYNGRLYQFGGNTYDLAASFRPYSIGNHAPILVTDSASYTLFEGGSLTFDAGASSDPDGDSFTAGFDFGDGQSWAPWSSHWAPHQYTTAGTYTLTITLNDGSLSRVGTRKVYVKNVAPTVYMPARDTIYYGEPVGNGGSFYDPGAGPWSATIAWDGGASSALPLYGSSFSIDSSLMAAGTHYATVRVTDPKGGAGTGRFYVSVLSPNAAMYKVKALVSAMTVFTTTDLQNDQATMVADLGLAASAYHNGDKSKSVTKLVAFYNAAQSAHGHGLDDATYNSLVDQYSRLYSSATSP